MNILDIIIAIPLIWLTFKGLKKGLVIELASLAALILGIYAAVHFSWFAGDFLSKNFDIEEKYLKIISFIITFIVIVIAVYAVGRIVEGLVKMVALGFLNSLGGAVFGFLKAALFLSVLLYFLNAFDSTGMLISKEKKNQSLLYNPIASIVPFLIPKLNLEDIDIRKEVEKTEEKIKETII